MNRRRIEELTRFLNLCSYKYYNLGKSEIEDVVFDNLLNELEQLENEEGYRLENSPTGNVGYKVLDKIKKYELPTPMLSLEKVKNDTEKVADFIKKYGNCIAMLKLDGSSLKLIYKKGKLYKGITRGNGIVGSDVTETIKNIPSIPLVLKEEVDCEINGEIIIRVNNFNIINDKLEEDEKFSNPRNLASGTLLNLNTNLAKKRMLEFIAFDLEIKNQHIETLTDKLKKLVQLDFVIAISDKIDIGNIEITIEKLKGMAKLKHFGIDGIVIKVDNCNKYKELGNTAKYPKGALAYKFQDEYEESRLKTIEWNVTRNGVLSPVAVFDKITISDTEIERASLHNLDIIRNLELGQGDIIRVVKANDIIPQIIENITKSNNIDNLIIKKCPSCRGELVEEIDRNTTILKCTNNECVGVLIKKIEHYCSKNCMDIKNISYETIRILVRKGIINKVEEIYTLKFNKLPMLRIPTFSNAKVDKILRAIEESKIDVEEYRFLNSLGIDGVGTVTSKAILEQFENIKELVDMVIDNENAAKQRLENAKGISVLTSNNIINYIKNNYNEIKTIMVMLKFKKETVKSDNLKLKDKKICITGKLNKFKNRTELQKYILDNGGVLVSKVSVNTDYLIDNSNNENSSKHLKAKKFNIPIITEEEFIKL